MIENRGIIFYLKLLKVYIHWCGALTFIAVLLFVIGLDPVVFYKS